MNIEALKRPLSISEIDFRVQSVKGDYAIILAYKDARADMIRLDEAVGPLNWKREHLNGNANCVVSLWDDKNKQWVSKEDTGSESNTEAAKGLASDSFKRACFNWGIGRELYDYPLIRVKLFDNEKANKWALNPRRWTWFSQFKNGKITYLAAKDEQGRKRFAWGVFDKKLEEHVAESNEVEQPKDSQALTPSQEPKQETAPQKDEDANIEGFLKKKADLAEDSPSELEQETPSAEDVKRNELFQKYKIMFGKEPRSNMKTETIQEKIDEETERKKAAMEKQIEKIENQPIVQNVEGEEEEAEESDDPYGEKKSNISDEQLDDIESKESEDEEDEVDLGMYGGDMVDDANKISSFTDREKLKNWAVETFKKWTGKVPEEHITEFKEACNKQFEKLG